VLYSTNALSTPFFFPAPHCSWGLISEGFSFCSELSLSMLFRRWREVANDVTASHTLSNLSGTLTDFLFFISHLDVVAECGSGRVVVKITVEVLS
jgi:hypothetical protein